MTSDPTPPAAQFAGHADLPGVNLWYSDSGGSGVPVVLLHANTGTSDSWQFNAPAFVAAGYRVVGFDRRGWGRSTAEPSTGPQPGSVAGDLQALGDYLRLDRFHLIGVAGGGFVAFDYALWHPERLRSLVVAASTGSVQDKELSEMTVRIRGPEFAALPVQFKEVSFSYMATNPDGLKEWLAIHARSQQPGAPSQPLRTEISFAKLETIRLPALLLAADNDLLAAPFIMRMQAAHLPDVELTLVPETGHAINWEQPEAFNRHVLAFIGRH